MPLALRIALLLLVPTVSACTSSERTPAPKTTQSSAPSTRPTSTSSPSHDDAALAARLRALLHRLDSVGATVSARVIELPTGRELYADRIDEPVIPASNLKVPVSAAALDRFGPDHPFKTFLAIDGDDLWLIGTGDPATGDPKIAARAGDKPTTMLDRWADALKARGVTSIKGDLYYYERSFDDVRIEPSWSRSFLGDWYAAPVSGLNFNDNCIDVTLRPAAPGEPAAYEVMPPTTDALRIVNRTRSAKPAGGTTSPATGRAAPAIDRQQDADVFTLTGTIAGQTSVESKSITDPGAFFADALRTNLASHGIAIAGRTLRADEPLGGADEPPAGQVVAVHVTPLREVLWRINKSSQNLFAEAVAKYQGRAFEMENGKRGARGSWASAGAAVRAFLRSQNIDDAGYTFVDGSGLARGNRVTTRGQTELLLAMSRHRHAAAFRESLSEAGRDGTLARRMPDLAGRVAGKTGSIGGVRALSVYIQASSGRQLIFSVIFNDLPSNSHKAAEALADDACRLLSQ